MTVRLPELEPRGPSVRVPPGRSVRLTPRFRDLIDAPAVQRLRSVRQLGPTAWVYPGATHSRFEHSLGVFGRMQDALVHLLASPFVAASLSEADLLAGLCAALLHDVGHYPFAHSLEALHRRGRDTPRHEALSASLIRGPLAAHIAAIGAEPERVAALVALPHSRQATAVDGLLAHLLSGGVDVDKLDYLERDSTHLGVPYGLGFDVQRLLEALVVVNDRLGVAASGRLSAEMFVFARYAMFSEVYWHHAVRAAAAMVEAALAALPPEPLGALERQLLSLGDDTFLAAVRASAPEGGTTARLLDHLAARRLYKRIATFSRAYAEPEKQAAWRLLYEADRDTLDRVSLGIAAALGGEPGDVLIDTPPRDKDHPEPITIVYGPHVTGRREVPLHELSGVVQGVSTDFVKVVKKVRVFAAPSLVVGADRQALHALVVEAVQRHGSCA